MIVSKSFRVLLCLASVLASDFVSAREQEPTLCDALWQLSTAKPYVFVDWKQAQSLSPCEDQLCEFRQMRHLQEDLKNHLRSCTYNMLYTDLFVLQTLVTNRREFLTFHRDWPFEPYARVRVAFSVGKMPRTVLGKPGVGLGAIEDCLKSVVPLDDLAMKMQATLETCGDFFLETPEPGQIIFWLVGREGALHSEPIYDYPDRQLTIFDSVAPLQVILSRLSR